MNLFAKLSTIEKKYALAFFGVAITILSVGFAIYTVYFMDRNPQVRYTVNSLFYALCFQQY